MNLQSGQAKFDSSGPLYAPLQLQLSIPNSPQKAKTLRFHLSLRNLSKNPVATYLDLSILSVISAELRTAKGDLINLWQGPLFQVALYLDGSRILPPLKSMENDWEWPEFYKNIDESMGEVQLQFVYNTGLIAPPLQNYKPPIKETIIFSNTLLLIAKGNIVHVLGDYHKLYPRIRRGYIQSGLHLTKQYDAQVEKPSVPVLRAIAADGMVRRTILTPYDLEGLVHLKTPQDALDFVRLFSARETRFLFRNTNFIEIYNKVPPREEGLGMDMYLNEKHRLSDPIVKKTREGYSVNRYLVTYPDASTKKSRLYLSAENVTESGKYQHRVAKVIAQSPFDGWLSFSPPYY